MRAPFRSEIKAIPKNNNKKQHNAVATTQQVYLNQECSFRQWPLTVRTQLVSLEKFKDIPFPSGVKPSNHPACCAICVRIFNWDLFSSGMVRHADTEMIVMQEEAYTHKSLKSEDRAYHVIQGHRGRTKDGEESTS